MIAEHRQFLDDRADGDSDGEGDVHRIRIALLGCGTVGGAAARLLIDARSRLRQSHGVDLRLTRILVRDAKRARTGIEQDLLTDDFDDVLNDEPDVVIEALGGREPAGAFVRRLLERGVNVVSANKTLIAHDGPELRAIADRSGARLAFEASVGAAIPVLAAIRQRAGDPIIALRAVLNGTCNFILNRMRESGGELNAVLGEAIERGFAEPDPSADVSGRDTAEKLCILAREAGFAGVSPVDVRVRGIEDITLRDLEAAREQGCVVRLIAELESTPTGGVRLCVGPMFVPIGHPLSRAKGAENVIVLDQEFAGRLTLHGEGAGPKPTAAAILGDVLKILHASASRVARAPTVDSTTGSARRAFVRVSRSHEAATVMRHHATHTHVRRDSIEVIVNEEAAIDAHTAFVATILE